MERVFIAGATSKLGRYLCAEYQRQGWYVIALVGGCIRVGSIAADQLVEAEAADALTLNGVIAGADLVVSCLGKTRQAEGRPDKDADYQAIVNLLREAERAGVTQFTCIDVSGVGDPACVSLAPARSAFIAELRRSAVSVTMVTPRENSVPFLSVLRALGLCDASLLIHEIDTQATPPRAQARAARVHQIDPERN